MYLYIYIRRACLYIVILLFEGAGHQVSIIARVYGHQTCLHISRVLSLDLSLILLVLVPVADC